MDLSELKEFKADIETIGKSYETLKATMEQSSKEKDALLEEKLRKVSEDVGNMYTDAKARLDAIEAKAQRPEVPAVTEKSQKRAETFNKSRRDMQFGVSGGVYEDVTPEQEERYAKAFDQYVRKGEKLLSADIMKDMSVGSDPDGGAWITPAEMSSTIITRVFETSPMRQISSVQTIGTREYVIPEDPNEAGGGWVGESAARPTTTTPQIARKTIVAHELYAMPQVTQQMMEDWSIDVGSYLGTKVADKFSRLENTAFASGTGVAQPRGFLTYASGTSWGQIEQVTSGTSNSFTYDGLLRIITAVKDKYHQNAVFLIRRASISYLLQIVDGSSRLIFQPILNGDLNKTPLMGYPLNYANDMPAKGAGALALAFGDFKAGYQIVDRIGISTIRDNLTSKPNVLFYTRKRVGGDVVDTDAIKLQVLT